jgi:hypothetical protein
MNFDFNIDVQLPGFFFFANIRIMEKIIEQGLKLMKLILNKK